MITMPARALIRPRLSDPAHVLVLKCAHGHYAEGKLVPSCEEVAAVLHISQAAAECALKELTEAGVLARARGGPYAVQPEATWRTPVPLPTPAVRAVLFRLISDLKAQQSAPGAELPSARRFAATYGVHEHDVRRALRLLAMDGIVALQPGRAPTVIRRLPVRRANAARVGRR